MGLNNVTNNAKALFARINTTHSSDNTNETLDNKEIEKAKEFGLSIFNLTEGMTEDDFIRQYEANQLKTNDLQERSIHVKYLQLQYGSELEPSGFESLKDYENRLKAEAGDKIQERPSIGLENSPETKEKTETREKPKRFHDGKKIHLPASWSNKRLADGVAEEIKLDETYTADEVLEKLITKFKVGNDINKDKLKADLIKYNPSIFNSKGEVYANADWTKLDFPTNAETLYSNKAPVKKTNPQTRTAQTVRTQSTPAAQGTSAQNNSQIDPNPPTRDTKNLPSFGSPIPERGSVFGDNMTFGTDRRTGAQLNRRPPLGAFLKPSYNRNGKLDGYTETRNGMTYKYDKNKILTDVYDKSNNQILSLSSDFCTEYYYNKNGQKTHEIERNIDGTVAHYYTYEGNATVSRTANGNVKNYWRIFDNRTVFYNYNGTVDSYYNYDDYETRSPDGRK